MTEEEAAEKWCPMVRCSTIVSGDGSAWNRLQTPDMDVVIPPQALCIGSACMFWRWASEMETDHDDRGYVSERYRTFSTTDGFCGLAGKP